VGSRPETLLWARLRRALPPTVYAARLETLADDGIPDVLLIWPSGVASLVELKAEEFLAEPDRSPAEGVEEVSVLAFRKVEKRKASASFSPDLFGDSPVSQQSRGWRPKPLKNPTELMSKILRPSQVAWHTKAVQKTLRPWVVISPHPPRVLLVPGPWSMTSATGPAPLPRGLLAFRASSLSAALDHIRSSDEVNAFRRLSSGLGPAP
jgi:hypothetical protein